MLEEQDGLRLAGTSAGDRLKKFHPRQRLCLDLAPDLNQEVVPNLKDFLTIDNGDFSKVPDNFADN